MRTLLAASGGGHLSELVELESRLPFDPGEVVWFTEDSVQSRDLLAGRTVVPAHPAPPRDWRAAARNAVVAAGLSRRWRIDAAVSTGASIAVSVLPVLAAAGAEAHYVESAARLEGPSVSGRILRAAPGVLTYSQYEGWSGPRWPLAGSVFDDFAPGPRSGRRGVGRVVVTVGSQAGYPFDRLVRRLAEVLPRESEVLWQVGASDAAAVGVPGVTAVTPSELATAMREADVVVAHAGVGSALTALRCGCHPVLVPRRRDAGEHVDDHQVQVAEELARRGLATTATPDTLDLGVLLDASERTVVRSPDVPPLRLGHRRSWRSSSSR